MILMTARCFMTESALLGLLKDRYESLLQSKSPCAMGHRRSLLLFVHQLLLSRERLMQMVWWGFADGRKSVICGLRFSATLSRL